MTIAVSPLTGRVFQGRLNKSKDSFVGDKKDITSDILRVIIEKSDFHGGNFDIEGGGKRFIVSVTEVPV